MKMVGKPDVRMSFKGMKRIGFFMLAACIAGVFCQAVNLPQPAGTACAAGQPAITFQGGTGDSPDTAVTIRGAVDEMAGVDAEYRYLREKFGLQQRDWRLVRQEVRRQGGRVFDVMHLVMADGAQRTIYFDITEFFGKM